MDFWHNHFNVDASQMVQMAMALPTYDRDVIRRHALEQLPGLPRSRGRQHRHAVYYLNNRSSRAGAANENYARSSFELHSLGREHYLNEVLQPLARRARRPQGQPRGFIDQDV